MKRRIINIAIFAVGIITCLLTLCFVFGFDQSKVDKFDEVVVLKENNPQMLEAFATATPENLPENITTYQAAADSLNKELKAEQLQKDILYTYICQLEEQTEATFPDFQKDFAHYSKVLFAQSDNAEAYTTGFAGVQDFTGLDKYVESLKKDYATVKNNYLEKKEYVKVTNSFLAQANAINDIVSTSKKETELKTFQDDIAAFSTGTKTLNASIIFVYIIVFITIGLLLAFSLMNIIGNFKESYKGLLGVIALVVIFFIGYLVSSPELTTSAIKMQHTASEMKWIGAGMFTFYIAFFGALVAIVGTIIMNAVKKAK